MVMSKPHDCLAVQNWSKPTGGLVMSKSNRLEAKDIQTKCLCWEAQRRCADWTGHILQIVGCTRLNQTSYTVDICAVCIDNPSNNPSEHPSKNPHEKSHWETNWKSFQELEWERKPKWASFQEPERESFQEPKSASFQGPKSASFQEPQWDFFWETKWKYFQEPEWNSFQELEWKSFQELKWESYQEPALPSGIHQNQTKIQTTTFWVDLNVPWCQRTICQPSEWILTHTQMPDGDV